MEKFQIHIAVFNLFVFVINEPLFINARLLDTSVSCDQNNFILSLNFDMPFQGLVYSEESFPNCVYVNGTMLTHASYQLKIPLAGCETRVNADGNFENGIIIQENSAFLQGTDKKYLLTCIPAIPPSPSPPSPAPPTPAVSLNFSPLKAPSPRENAVTVDFGAVSVQNAHTTAEVIHGTLPPTLTAADADSPPQPELRYSVEIRTGHSLDAPAIVDALNIGDPISYVVRLQKPVSESQIGRCWASDSTSNLELSDEKGCSMQPRGNIWGAFERLETQQEVIFVNRIKAWAFPTSNEVNIFCNLRICMSQHCAFSNCSASNAAAADQRKRRENQRRLRRRHNFDAFSFDGDGLREIKTTISDMTEVETLRTQIRFRRQAQLPTFSATKLITRPPPTDSLENNGNNYPRRQDSSVCVSTAELALLISCAVVFLFCTVLLVAFTCLRRRRVVRGDNRDGDDGRTK